MKKTIYRFHAYKNVDFPPRFLLRRGDYKVDLMGWSRFLDLLFDSIQTRLHEDYFEDGTPVITRDWEQVFVDMDRLCETNLNLYLKTIHFLNGFDDFGLTTTKICEWLDELEDFVCAKVLN